MKTLAEIKNLYSSSLISLISEAVFVHRYHFNYDEIQAAKVTSIKTGGCKEDCIYCAQSSKYHINLPQKGYLDEEIIISQVQEAKKNGCTRFCMAAAWSKPETTKQFDRILRLLQKLKVYDLDLCCSLGMISFNQACALKESGLTIYNHNIDTGESYYSNIVTSRVFSDRINTLENAIRAGLKICSGGILGLGENDEDRAEMIYNLNTLSDIPESIPVNLLVPIKGTSLENNTRISIWEIIRFISTLRIVFPTTRIKLSAGRSLLSFEEQALCFIAGVNAVFTGDKLLTTDNIISPESDTELFKTLGIKFIKLRN
ncbi:MAG: biotin synthase BioB [Chitinophagaceae bacterium]|jgi:biotin synthase|nr:biotin synthase BioB [Chitinophagaceae bacterium]